MDAFWSINQQTNEKDAEVGRGFVIKHRNGRSRFPFRIGFDFSLGTLDMFEISDQAYGTNMNLMATKKTNEVIRIDGKPKKKWSPGKGQEDLDGIISPIEDYEG